MTLLHEIVSSFPKNNFFPVILFPFHASVSLNLCQCSGLFMLVQFGVDAGVFFLFGYCWLVGCSFLFGIMEKV